MDDQSESDKILWWTIRADSVSPRMNTIASRDQFKPMGIGENLAVTIKADSAAPQMNIIASRDQFRAIGIGEI